MGEVTGFTTYDPVKDRTFDEYVVMEVVIDKVLKGEADSTIRLVWTNSLNARAPIGVGKQTILFAAHPVRKPEERFRDPDRELWSQAEWNVAYQSCSAAYIDAWSLQRETAWREVLDGDGSFLVDPSVPDGPDMDLEFELRSTEELRRDLLLAKLAKIAIPLSAIVLLIALIIWNRRRRTPETTASQATSDTQE